MQTGAITAHLDVAQLTLYAFFVFFIGLIWYLRQEDKREGYPLVSDRADNPFVQGLPPMPPAKTFLLCEGATYQAPPGAIDRREVKAGANELWPGAPLQPSGNAMQDAVGPASYAERADEPDMTAEHVPMIVPLRVAKGFYVEERDPDPRGMQVIAGDGVVAGTVSDLWIDRSEPQIRYLEVDVAGGGSKLVPMNLARIDARRRTIKVRTVMADQLADAPGLANPDQVTLREEDRIMGYFGGGQFYAKPSRAEPIL